MYFPMSFDQSMVKPLSINRTLCISKSSCCCYNLDMYFTKATESLTTLKFQGPYKFKGPYKFIFKGILFFDILIYPQQISLLFRSCCHVIAHKAILQAHYLYHQTHSERPNPTEKLPSLRLAETLDGISHTSPPTPTHLSALQMTRLVLPIHRPHPSLH